MNTTFKSLLTTFGGAIKFSAPVNLDFADWMLLGAGFREGSALVHLNAFGEDTYRAFADLSPEMKRTVCGILSARLTPENIRITIGDLIHVNRIDNPFYGVVADTGGVVYHVDTRGMIVDTVPVVVLFGHDDYSVVGHREFTQAILDCEAPDAAYEELLGIVRGGKPIPPFWKRHRAFTGQTGLEKASGRKDAQAWNLVGGCRACIVEYKGIEALAYTTPDGKPWLHPLYAYLKRNDVVTALSTL